MLGTDSSIFTTLQRCEWFMLGVRLVDSQGRVLCWQIRSYPVLGLVSIEFLPRLGGAALSVNVERLLETLVGLIVVRE